MLDMGFREDLEEILDATPAGAPHAAVLGDHAADDRRAGQALPEGRAAHRHRRRASAHGDIDYQAMPVAPREHRACGGQPAALPRGPGALVFCATREARAAPARQPDRARLPRRRAVGRAQPERAQPGAAGAARRARAGLRRDRRRRARHRPARPRPRHPCRAAARRRDAPAPLAAAPGAPGEGHRACSSSPIRAASGSNRCCAAPGSRPSGSSRRRPRTSASSDHERLLARSARAGRDREEDRDAGPPPAGRAKPPEEIAAALVRAHRARMPAPEELVDAGGRRRAARPTARARLRGHGLVPHGHRPRATMPTRAGCCLCSAAAATSPSPRSAPSASPPARPCSRSRAAPPAVSPPPSPSRRTGTTTCGSSSCAPSTPPRCPSGPAPSSSASRAAPRRATGEARSPRAGSRRRRSAQALRPGGRARPRHPPQPASCWSGRTRNGRRPPGLILIPTEGSV